MSKIRDPKRVDRIALKINKLWNKFPDWTLSQLIVNITNTSDTFDVSDELLEEQLDHWIRISGI